MNDDPNDGLNDGLARRLRAYRDDLETGVRPPVPARATAPSHPRRRRTLVLAVGGAAIASLVAVAVFVSRGDDEHSVAPGSTVASTDSSPPSTAGDSWAWLAAFGAETPAPPVPAGWQTMDFGDFRFSVPNGWVAPIDESLSCVGELPPGAVFLPSRTTMSCSSDPASSTTNPPAVPTLTVRRSTGTMTEGVQAEVGTLSARRVDPACSTCAPIYRFADGYEVTVTGADASTILATFTDSGARRVVQTGTSADTCAWKTVEFDGVALRVPSSWPTVDLPKTVFRTTDAAGNVNGGGGMIDPGGCGRPLFGDVSQASAFLDHSGITSSCTAAAWWNMTLNDSVWMRSQLDGEVISGNEVAHGAVDGLDVTVYAVDQTQQPSPDPTLELVVETPQHRVLISLGVGTDTSIARAILHSLHAP